MWHANETFSLQISELAILNIYSKSTRHAICQNWTIKQIIIVCNELKLRLACDYKNEIYQHAVNIN